MTGDHDMRDEAARLTAVSDQMVATITNPDINRQLVGLLQRAVIMAEVFAGAGIPPEHVVGQISGEVSGILAKWLVARRLADGEDVAEAA